MKKDDLVTIVVNEGDWDESKHPRAEDGKFTSGGGGGGDDGDENGDGNKNRAVPSNENYSGWGSDNDNNPFRATGRDDRLGGGGGDTRHGDNDNGPPPRGPTGGRRLKKAA